MKNKAKFSTHRLQPVACPVCFTKLDAATNVGGDDPPRPGDFTVCIQCCNVLRYDAVLGLMASSLAECPIEIRSRLANIKMLTEEVKRGSKPWVQ